MTPNQFRGLCPVNVAEDFNVAFSKGNPSQQSVAMSCIGNIISQLELNANPVVAKKPVVTAPSPPPVQPPPFQKDSTFLPWQKLIGLLDLIYCAKTEEYTAAVIDIFYPKPV
jgi:hypothetical protein